MKLHTLALSLCLAALAVPLGGAPLTQTAVAQASAPTKSHDRFFVTVTGKGPDVVLIPGLASSGEVWADTAKRLSATHRVHVVQVAGFAGSPAGANASGAVLAPLVDQLADYVAHLKRPAIIGHSMGGLAAIEIAARKPDAVGRVMIVDALPFYALVMNPAATAESIAPQAAALGNQLRQLDDATFAANQDQGLTRLAKTPDALEKIRAWGKSSDRRVVTQAMLDDLVRDARPELPAIKAAVTVVYAYDEAMGAQGFIDGLYASAYRGLAGAQLRRVDGGYHFIMLDQPEAFAAEVDRFLK